MPKIARGRGDRREQRHVGERERLAVRRASRSPRGEPVEHRARREGDHLDRRGPRRRAAARRRAGRTWRAASGRMIPWLGVQIRARCDDDDGRMDAGAIKAAAAASAASYRSFADATRSVLDLLERLMPDCALYLSHLDRAHDVHRIVDTRAGGELGLRSNLATPLDESYDIAMADERAPRLCNDVSADPVYAGVGMQRRAGAGSYLGVPLELSDGSRVGALAALSRAGRPLPPRRRAALHDARARARLRARARVQRARPAAAQRLAARPRARHGRRRPRRRACWPAARTAAARSAAPPARWRARPVAFLLEPSGREFVSTAMSGVDMAPVTIQPRPETTGRAFTARESYFVADARDHPALAQPLVDATVGALGAVRAGAARRAGLRRADRDLAAADRARCRRPPAGCCGCSPPRPPSRSSTPACARAWRRSR